MAETYDVLILGGGPAGLTAAIYAGRYNMKALVIANSFGGTANLAGEVENWPGFIGAGRDLMRTVYDQAKRFGAEFLEASIEKVERLEIRDEKLKGASKGVPSQIQVKEKLGQTLPPAQVASADANKGGNFVLHYGGAPLDTSSDQTGQAVRGKSLIVALGTEHRQLNIPGEKEFLGKGVSYCATCDGNFFKGKEIAVIGGADSAAKAALYLADICDKVTVVYRGNEMRCEPVSLSAICDKENIEIMYYTSPSEVVGDGVVKGLKVVTDDNGKKVESVLNVSGVFIEAGAVPATEVLKELGVEMVNGYVVTGKDCKTNVEGVFAAGDVTNSEMRQMITAAGEGAVAAKGAHEFLQKNL